MNVIDRYVITEAETVSEAKRRARSLLAAYDEDERPEVMAIVNLDTNILELTEEVELHPFMKEICSSVNGLINRINEICATQPETKDQLINTIHSLRTTTAIMSAFDLNKLDEQMWNSERELKKMMEYRTRLLFPPIKELGDLYDRIQMFPEDLNRPGFNNDVGWDGKNLHPYVVACLIAD